MLAPEGQLNVHEDVFAEYTVADRELPSEFQSEGEEVQAIHQQHRHLIEQVDVQLVLKEEKTAVQILIERSGLALSWVVLMR